MLQASHNNKTYLSSHENTEKNLSKFSSDPSYFPLPCSTRDTNVHKNPLAKSDAIKRLDNDNELATKKMPIIIEMSQRGHNTSLLSHKWDSI